MIDRTARTIESLANSFMFDEFKILLRNEISLITTLNDELKVTILPRSGVDEIIHIPLLGYIPPEAILVALDELELLACAAQKRNHALGGNELERFLGWARPAEEMEINKEVDANEFANHTEIDYKVDFNHSYPLALWRALANNTRGDNERLLGSLLYLSNKLRYTRKLGVDTPENERLTHSCRKLEDLSFEVLFKMMRGLKAPEIHLAHEDDFQDIFTIAFIQEPSVYYLQKTNQIIGNMEDFLLDLRFKHLLENPEDERITL